VLKTIEIVTARNVDHLVILPRTEFITIYIGVSEPLSRQVLSIDRYALTGRSLSLWLPYATEWAL